MKKRILISAGEASGDLHASNMIKELLKESPEIEMFGIGCQKMEALGVSLLERMDQHAIIGITEVIKSLSFIKNLFAKFEKELKKGNVALAVFVDYPGFNMKLAKMCNKYNVPCVYYITPQVWAWGQWRVKTIKSLFEKCFVIFDFEETFFKKHGVDATFVGHPLLDEKELPAKEGHIKNDLYTIGLLPGSRPNEIRTLLPKMIKAVNLLKKKKELRAIISKSPNIPLETYSLILKNHNAEDIELIEGNVANTITSSDFVIACSGTVTLQVAIAKKPMVIVYITSWITFLLGMIFVRPPIGLVNIISGKYIVDELLQFLCTPKNIASKAWKVISSGEKYHKMENDLGKVKSWLGEPGASSRTASYIKALLEK